MTDPKKPAALVDDPPAQPQPAAEVAALDQALDVVAPTTARAPVRMGVAPTTVDEAWRLSRFIADSEMVPKGYRKRPADVLVAIQLGMELGLPPMAALHSIFVANGQPNLYGDGFLAVIMASPVYRDHDEYFEVGAQRRETLTAVDLQKDDTQAVCTFWRVGSARPRTATFSIAKAKKAGLWSKAGPWSEYPDRMLKFRARGFAGRDAFPDILRGIRIDVEVADLPPAPVVPTLLRRSDAAAQTSDAPVVIDPIRLGPTTIAQIDPFVGGCIATLADGTVLQVSDATDARDLEKLKDAQLPVRFDCVKDGDQLQLLSFALVD